MRTSRVRIKADHRVDTLLSQGVPVIYALWHCHVFFMPLLRRYGRQPLAVLLSSHRDARIVGVAARLRGVDLVRGSSTRGGTHAYRQLLQRLSQGQSVCLTPDGPKGPPQQVKRGVIRLAVTSGCAVVPVAFATSRQRRLRSWDRSVLPLPFSYVLLVLGAPLQIDPAADPFEQQALLVAALNATGHQAEAGLAAP